jgi:hypothetical protein
MDLESHIISVLCSSQRRTMARYREMTPLGRWVGDDSEEELDVFAAERYFNGDDALWYASSSSAFRTGTTTHEHGRSSVAAATSSSEASSWNSRSALLADGKKVPPVPAPSVVEAESCGTGSQRSRGKPPPPCHLRRWLFGVAARACVGDDGVESASDNVGGSKVADDGVGETFRGTGRSKELAVRVRPGRPLDDGDDFLAGHAAFPPVSRVQLAGDVHRQPVNPGEFSTPILNQATTTTGPSPPERRRESSETLRQHGVVLSAKKQGSAFTIVAGGNTAVARGGGGGPTTPATAHGGPPPGTSRCGSSEDDTAPSEASVVWSVVTAEGAASCDFSSAASGYHYHVNGGEDGAVPQTARRRRRRSSVSNGGGLLTCMGDKAVDAVRPASVGRPGARNDSQAECRPNPPPVTS